MFKRSSLTWPIILGVTLLVLIVGLLVLWIITQAGSQRWALLTIGTVFFALIMVGVVMYLVLAIKEVNLNKRQANFIDSVTHELKSPIASIKLYLQTLDLREVSESQQKEFHRFMLEDVQRLDSLIDHLLVAARLDADRTREALEEVHLADLVAKCAEDVCRRYTVPPEKVVLELQPCRIKSRVRDLEMIFGNLLDNAVKYGGREPEIMVQMELPPAAADNKRHVIIRISDNGRGVPFELRSKIFRRFFRGGSELERTTKGTGLGLYIVKSLVGKLKGKVTVHGRGAQRGAMFEVDLPGAIVG